MSRIISCGYRSASKLSALSFRSVIVPINGSDAMFCRLMSTNVSNSEMEEKKEQPTGMSEAVKDFSIPIEQLETPRERYQRVVILYRKPNQISKNMLNRYFKLCKSEEDLPFLQKLFNFLDTKHTGIHPVAANSLITNLLSISPATDVYNFVFKHPLSLQSCPSSAYEKIMDGLVEEGRPEKIRTVIKATYPKWPKEQSYIDHAIDLLLGCKKLGTAYSIVQELAPFESLPSTTILEKMLDTAVQAKDPKRAEGLALLLKKQGIEKTYEITGELEKPYYLEQKARREKKEAETAKGKEEAEPKAEGEEKQAKEGTKKKEVQKEKETPNASTEKK
ncbi:hypothetical protein WA171_002825 [Blastocystis sp. BT1]